MGLRLVDHRSRLVAPHDENSRAKPKMSVNMAPVFITSTVSRHGLREADRRTSRLFADYRATSSNRYMRVPSAVAS